MTAMTVQAREQAAKDKSQAVVIDVTKYGVFKVGGCRGLGFSHVRSCRPWHGECRVFKAGRGVW